MRETEVKLDCELALHTQWQTAMSNGHKVVRVRICPSIHATKVKTFQSGVDGLDATMYAFCQLYDTSTRHDIADGHKCGTLLDVPVILDSSLAPQSIVLESEPRETNIVP